MTDPMPSLGLGERIELGAKQLWRSTTVNPAPKSPWRSAIRRGLLVGVIVAIGAATGHLAEGGVAAIGALNLGLVDGAVARRTLFTTMALATVTITVLAALTPTIANTWWLLPLLMSLGFTHGVVAGSGMIALNASLMSLITALLFAGNHESLDNATRSATWVLVGCLLAFASGLVAWRRDREASVRRALAINLRSSAALIKNTNLSGSIPRRVGNQLSAASAETEAETAVAGARFDPAKQHYFGGLLDQMMWVRLSLAEWLQFGTASSSQALAVERVVLRVATEIESPKRHGVATAQSGVDEKYLAGDSDQLALILNHHLTGLCQSAEGVGADRPLPASGGTKSISDQAAKSQSVKERVASVAGLFSPKLPTFRHGTRLALGMALAVCIWIGFDVPHGYWIALTVALVVKPEFSTTVVRGFLRILGNLAAVLCIGALIEAGYATQVVLVTMVVILGPLVMRWFTGNYGLASFVVASLVLVLAETSEPNFGTVELRIQNTLIGAAIAIVCALVWPSWRSADVPQLLCLSVETQRRWSASVLRALATPEVTDLADIRIQGKASRDAALAARPAAEAVLLEPRQGVSDPRAALELLDALQLSATATLALEVALTQPPPTGTNLTRERLESDSHLADRAFRSAAKRLQALVEPGTVDPVATESSDDVSNPREFACEANADTTADAVFGRALSLLVSSSESTAVAAASMGTSR